MIAKQYLGDSVYAEDDGFGIVLTTENGLEASNTIILEWEVLLKLEQYIAKVKAAAGIKSKT